MIIAIIVFTVACERNGFEIYDCHLKRTADGIVDQYGTLSDMTETAELSLRVSASDAMSYSFCLIAPDGDLSWEGSFDESFSESLMITPGASFLSGIYTLYILAEDGSEAEQQVQLGNGIQDYIIPHFDENGIFVSSISSDVNCEAYSSGDLVFSGIIADGASLDLDSGFAVISFTDRYGNMVSLRESFD